MTTVLLSALPAELDDLVLSTEGVESDPIADWPTWIGRYGNQEVVLTRAGLGKVNTAALSALLWEKHHPSLMIFTGVAGGLDPALAVGDIVVGTKTVQHDAGVISAKGFERYQAGHIPFYNPTDEYGFTPSDSILEILHSVVPTFQPTPVLDREPDVVFGTIVTGDVFLQDEPTRARLHRELSAQAIEMEGGALGQVAARLGVDHVVIRSLSDLAGGEASRHFDRFVSEVSANSARLVLALLERLEEDDRDLPFGP